MTSRLVVLVIISSATTGADVAAAVGGTRARVGIVVAAAWARVGIAVAAAWGAGAAVG